MVRRHLRIPVVETFASAGFFTEPESTVRRPFAFGEKYEAMPKYEERAACTFLPTLGRHHNCEYIA